MVTPLYLWNETEDPTLPLHPDSWCARLGDTTVADLCEVCDSSPQFLLASASDFTIKENNPEIFLREQYNGDGTWRSDGYWTMLQSDMSLLGANEEKIVKQLVVDFEAEAQEPPSQLVGEVAYSSQPKCQVWKNIGSRELKCLTAFDEAQHAANNTRADRQARYNTFYRGKYIGFRIYTGGVGGSSCFGQAALAVAKANARNF